MSASSYAPVIDLLRCEVLVLRQRRRVLKLRERLEENEDILRALIQASVMARAATTLPADDAGDDLPSRDGEATGAERSGVDDLSRGQTVARSGETGRQPTASSAPGDPPAASAELLAPSGTAGNSSAGSGAEPVSASAGVAAPEPRRGFASGRSPGVQRGGSHFGRQATDETGNRYGKLVIIERAPNDGVNARWRCECDCGAETLVIGRDLRKGKVDACPACRMVTGRRCSGCGERGHNARGCPVAPAPESAPPTARRCIVKRSRGAPGAAPSAPRPKRFVCFKCGSMPHRVEGVRCMGCGLERSEERLDVGDFALSRAIG